MSSFLQSTQMTNIPTDPPPSSTSSQLIPDLPNDVALWCLARIPRSYHPIISLVCKSWHSILRSSSLFHTRSLLGATESFLYLNLRHNSTFNWYVLFNVSPTKRSLIRLPSFPIQNDTRGKMVVSPQKNDSQPSQPSTKISQINQPFAQNEHFTPGDNIAKEEIKGKMAISQVQPSTQHFVHNDNFSEEEIKDDNFTLRDNFSKEETKGKMEPTQIGHITKDFLQNDHFTPNNDSSNGEIKGKRVLSHNEIAARLIEYSSTKHSLITQPFVQNDHVTPNDNFGKREIKGNMVISDNKIAAQPICTGKSPINRHCGLSHRFDSPKRQPIGPSFAVCGSNICLIGGSHNEIPSNAMWIFDCRFNVWEPGPKMRVGREFSAAGVVDGKIYVMGGCVVDNWARSMNCAEVFDPVKGVWAPVPSSIEVRDKWMHASAVIGGKVYAMADRGGVVYDARKGEWGGVSKRLDLGWRGRAAVVGDVLYCYDYLGKIRGYDVEEDRWKELRGVGKLLPKFLCGATMVNFDGKLCVVWEQKGSGKDLEIMCAEIEVKKDVDGGLNGVILWCDVILAVPNSAFIVQCLVVEL